MKTNDQVSTNEKMQAITRVLRRVVHDLNNFSTIFINISELIKDDLQGNDSALRKLDMLDDTSSKLQEYIGELSSLKTQAGSYDNDCNINRAVNEALITFEQCTNVSVQSTQDNIFGHLSHDKVVEIVKGLIQNSLESSESQPADIRIKLSSKGEQAKISVTDNGCGLSKEELSHLFEPYFSKKENEKEAGLTLSKAFYYLKGAGGSFEVSSEKGVGTKVVLAFPKGRPVFDDEPGEDALEDQEGKGGSFEGIKILIVDDQDPLRKIAKEMLQSGGYKVFEASNGVEALEVVKGGEGKEVNVLITDIVMPLMGGRELSAKLTQENPNLKVLFMSGYNNDGIFDAEASKNFGFLNKPFTKHILLDAVAKVLG